MARPELGTKRVCPETGRKFYDLNKDPIVSPYTGKTYPISFFEEVAAPAPAPKAKPKEPEKEEAEVEETEELEQDDAVVSLEDADEDANESDDANLPDLGDNTDDEVLDDDDEDDDTFLATDDEDDDDDVSDIIDVGGDKDDD